jgi:hypothetical protein
MRTINQRIKDFIYLSGLTHRQVSRDLEINDQQFNNWLNNTKPSVDGLTKIINYFPEMNARWLMTGNGSPKLSDQEDILNSANDRISIIELKNVMKEVQRELQEIKTKNEVIEKVLIEPLLSIKR